MVKTGASLIGLAGTLILAGVALNTLEQIDRTTKININKFKVPNVNFIRKNRKRKL